MKQLLYIGCGGFIGSVCRYWMQWVVSKYITNAFPLGTFIVNLTGCFLIGILAGVTARYVSFTIEWRLFLMTGICGGYTTFSTFSLESISLFRQGNYAYFFLYISMSVVLGLLATLAGFLLLKAA